MNLKKPKSTNSSKFSTGTVAAPIDAATVAIRLKRGEIGVLPTDTLYGIVGSAIKPVVVERIYALRRRELDKPMIVLIGSWADLSSMNIKLTSLTADLLRNIWPGPVSVIVPVSAPNLKHLHRGTGGIAFRMPAQAELRLLLESTGPLVAPSANIAGEEPATTVAQAQEYFEDEVFYVDRGELRGSPSALIDARQHPPKILRSAPGFSLN